ncbi:hypothetical protein GCM10009751_33890 [Myceligenerans crystallogenes]|uniref:Uncharacterized protein n=1 Tax=Myceligenerans crystallogenes TaxID=316335 RepID=A0ABN2NMJ3_9MICO
MSDDARRPEIPCVLWMADDVGGRSRERLRARQRVRAGAQVVAVIRDTGARVGHGA